MRNIKIANQFYYVYVLKSLKDGNFYIGSTNNLKRRFKEHDDGKVFSTRLRLPFELVYYEACLTEKDARMREKYLKTSWGKRYIKNRIKYFLGIVSFVFLLFFSLAFPVRAGELSDHFNIAFWTKPESSVTSQAILVKNNELRIVTDGSGNPLCQIHNGAAWQTAAVSSQNLVVGSWVHLACSYDKNNLKIYVNGIEKGSQSLSISLQDTANTFKFGKDDSGNYNDYNGLIDDVRIYNYALTQKQILEVMAGGDPSRPGRAVKYPVLALSFDKGYGGTAYDSNPICRELGSNCHNGTLYPGTGGANTATSAMWTLDGKVGKAMEFDGVDDYVISNFQFSSFNQFSISQFINFQTLAAGKPIIGQWGGSQNAVLIKTDDTNADEIKVCIASGLTDNCANYGVTGKADLSADTWYNLQVVYNGDRSGNSGRLKVYLNGEEQTLNFGGTIPAVFPDSSENLEIGGDSDLGQYSNALIDEVKVYNYALDEDEIKTLYNQGFSAVMGAGSTATTTAGAHTPSNAASREYCVPGSDDYCAPPVLELKFDEKQGTTAYDTSGNGNDGTINGASWTRGKFGSALSFDGSDDYVDCGSPSSLDNFYGTISFWVYPTAWDTAIFSKGPWNSTSPRKSITLESNYYGNSNVLVARWSGSTSSVSRTFDNSFPINRWVYLTVNFNSDGKIYIYENGKILNLEEQTAGSGFWDDNLDNAYIGVNSDSDAHMYFNGLIDQVRIYNYARTPSQIAWDFNRGKPIAHWRFDECSGSTIYDSAKSWNGGTANNGVLHLGASGVTATGTCASSSDSFWYNGRSGKYNSAGSFDGTDDYVVANDKPEFSGGHDITVSVWFKADVLGGAVGAPIPLVMKYKDTQNKDWGLGIVNSKLHFGYESSGNNWNNAGLNGKTVLNTQNWYHALFTYTNSSRLVKLFLNGSEESSVIIPTVTPDTTQNIEIGRSGYKNGYFDGLIDEVKIYNYALTPAQIKQEYAGGAVRFGD